MKKNILVFVISFLLFSIIVNSQIVYPVQITIGWDKNLESDQVIDYTLVHNNGMANQSFTIPLTACIHALADGQCRQVVNVPGASMQTVSVVARNMWGTSAPEIVTFTVTAPGKARNIKIRSGS